jgi:hypothetical protein
VRSDPKHRQLARQVGGVSTIQASSMAVTFYSKITLRPGSVFCFGTISSVANEEGTLRRIADPPEKKSPPTDSENAGEAQPPALRKKIVSGKSGAEGPLTRRTPLSTSPTKEWTQIARKKETKGKQVVLSVPPPSKENGKKVATTAAPFYPDVLFIGRVESPTVSDDEPTAPGEEPPQRESRRRRNRRRNVRRHHAAGERDPEQPVSRDEVSEIGETPEERVFRERRNSRRRDRRRAQEQAEQDARQRRENPFFGRNLNPDFARAMNTPSEVGGLSTPSDSRRRGLPTTVHPGGQPSPTACSPAKRSTTRHQQSPRRAKLHQCFARTTALERDSPPGGVRQGSWHPGSEPGHQN